MLTCSNPSVRFSVHAAMDRNKYIYALSEYAVVVSSKEGNDETWAGATENLKKSFVPLFVYSYDKMHAGNEKLTELVGNPLSLEIIENNDISLRHWLKGNKIEILLQASLF